MLSIVIYSIFLELDLCRLHETDGILISGEARETRLWRRRAIE
jgi:hypothetical protein